MTGRAAKYAIALVFALLGLAIVHGKIPGLPGVVGDEWEYIQSDEATATTSPPATPPSAPPPGLEEMTFPLSAPAPLEVESPAFAFADTNPDGTPVLFSPCRPIHFVIRPDHSPVGGEREILDAVAAVSAATGLVFVHDGATSEAPAAERAAYQPDRYGDRWAPVLIAWISGVDGPELSGDLVGEATTYQLVRSNGFAHYVTGQIVLDADRVQKMIDAYGDRAMTAVIKHELGHLVGLAHVTLDTELMYPETRLRFSDFQPGDLTGLSEAGKGTCAPDL